MSAYEGSKWQEAQEEAARQQREKQYAPRPGEVIHVQRPVLTFAEALEAWGAGKCLRTDQHAGWIYWEGRDGTIRRSDRPYGTRCLGPGEPGAAVDLNMLMTSWNWHIVEDKPKKSRLRELAEKYCSLPGDALSESKATAAMEEFGREVIAAVAKWIGERERCIPSSLGGDIIKAFLEPR